MVKHTRWRICCMCAIIGVFVLLKAPKNVESREMDGPIPTRGNGNGNGKGMGREKHEYHSCTSEPCNRRLRGMESDIGVHTTLVVSEVSLAQRRQAGEVEHTVEVEGSPEVDVRLDGNAGGDASHLFVNAPESICDDLWASWPSIQESGLANKNVIVYKPLASVGNDFLRLQTLISIARELQVALVLDWGWLEGFRQAFDPAQIRWDVDHTQFYRFAGDVEQGLVQPNGLHVMRFSDCLMLLTDSQMTWMADALEVEYEATATPEVAVMGVVKRIATPLVTQWPRIRAMNAPQPQPCAWNMLLQRSAGMRSALKTHNPFRAPTDTYAAWHIRTPDGETSSSYDRAAHPYVIEEPSSAVCPAYTAATVEVEQSCGYAEGLTVFVASNSMGMENNCTTSAREEGRHLVFADVGLAPGDVHTAHTQNASKVALNAFIDFLFVLDAEVIVCTGSSFSASAARIKELQCHRIDVPGVDPAARGLGGLMVCARRHCAHLLKEKWT